MRRIWNLYSSRRCPRDTGDRILCNRACPMQPFVACLDVLSSYEIMNSGNAIVRYKACVRLPSYVCVTIMQPSSFL